MITRPKKILILSIVLALTSLIFIVLHKSYTRSDILDSYAIFQSLLDTDITQAYQMMSPDYRSSNSIQEFELDFYNSVRFGADENNILITSMFGTKAYLMPTCDSIFELLDCGGPTFFYKKINGTWYIEKQEWSFS